MLKNYFGSFSLYGYSKKIYRYLTDNGEVRDNKTEWLDVILNDWKNERQLLSELFASKLRDEWNDLFEGKLCCTSPVNGQSIIIDGGVLSQVRV